ncbi:MAG: DUF4401 domain-containing protein [Colwellia sp.]|nr:DUF4401 domain-containing protein [Colwellia sp.]
MPTIKNALWAKLKEADLVQGETPKTDPVNSPWYIKMLLAISGWLGAIFLLGFFFSAFSSLLEKPIASFFISLPLLLIAYSLLRAPNNEFYEHLALAISLSGQALLVRSVIEWESSALIWLTVAVSQVLLAYLMPSFLHRVFSTLFAALSFAASLAIIGAPHLLGSFLIFPLAWLCLNEFSFANQYKRNKGLMYGLVIAMLLLKCSDVFGADFEKLLLSTSETLIQIPSWASYIIYLSALVFTSWQLLSANHVEINTKFSKMVLLFTFILGLATFKAAGIGVGLVVLVLGFAHSNPTLLGLGVMSLLVYSSTYYYLMEETLLFKSGVLLVVAALMLVSRVLFDKIMPALKDK